MTVTIPVTTCPDCFGAVYAVRTALGLMMRCEACRIDWFPDVTVELPDEESASNP